MIEIFAPYLPFISFLFVIIVNVVLIFKGGTWISVLILNVIIFAVNQFLTVMFPVLNGLIEYDLLSILFDYVYDTIDYIFDKITDGFSISFDPKPLF